MTEAVSGAENSRPAPLPTVNYEDDNGLIASEDYDDDESALSRLSDLEDEGRDSWISHRL